MAESAGADGSGDRQRADAPGTLARLSEDVLLLGETYDEMVGRIVAHIQGNGSMTVAQVRDAFNTSRKYALAIMEHLDEKKITRRVGDERVLR